MCYGLDKIPEGDWACDLCLRFGKKGKLLRCPLCSCRGGALKETNQSASKQNFQIKNPGYFMFANSAPPFEEEYIQTRFRLSLHCEPRVNQTSKHGVLTTDNLFSRSTADLKNSDSQEYELPKDHKNFENEIEKNLYYSMQDQKRPESLEDNIIMNIDSYGDLDLQKNFSFGLEGNHEQVIPSLQPMCDFTSLLQPEKITSELFCDYANNEVNNEMEIELDKLKNNDLEVEENLNTQNGLKVTLNDTCATKSCSKANNGLGSPVSKLTQPHTTIRLSESVSLLYDFYRESYRFSETELEEEPVTEQSWMHLSCLYWHPELSIKHTPNLAEVKGLSQIPQTRFNTQCDICNQQNGACVSCTEEGCPTLFHVECARRAKLHLEIHNTFSATRFLIYCPSHTPLTFKTALHSQEKRQREDILRLHRAFKRFFRVRKIRLDEPRIPITKMVESYEEKQRALLIQKDINSIMDGRKCSIASNDPPSTKSKKIKTTTQGVRPQRISSERYVEGLDRQSKLFLLNVKEQVEDSTEFTFHVNLKRENEDQFSVQNVNVPLKSLFRNRPSKNFQVWKNIAEELSTSVKAVVNRFNKLTEHLQTCERRQDPLSPLKGEVEPTSQQHEVRK